jgi:hypothetical protein
MRLGYLFAARYALINQKAVEEAALSEDLAATGM